MNQFYFDLTINAHRGSYSEFVGKIMSPFHGSMKCYGENSPLAIGFPKWHQNIDPNHSSFGNTIRFFGDKVDLSVWFCNETIEKLEDMGIISIDPIKPVPADAPHVRYIRDRRIEKAIKRNGGADILAYPPSVLLKSASNGKSYPIRVRMEKSLATTGLFNSYGLSNGDNPGTVPFF